MQVTAAIAGATSRSFGMGIVNATEDRAKARRAQVKQWITAFNLAEPADLSAIDDTVHDATWRTLSQRRRRATGRDASPACSSRGRTSPSSSCAASRR